MNDASTPRADHQRRIDSISWYHEIDFGNGLMSRSREPGIERRREFWRFIELTLDAIDVAGKSVLDVGCWDGRWSFYAERRGASSVLAVDDVTQNWGTGEGIRLAKELLNSRVEIDQRLSVYDLATLGRRFDVVLFLGVYYHLLDPMRAIIQLRHCCHENTVLVVEGDTTHGLLPRTAYVDLSDPHSSVFVPGADVLQSMLESAYFTVRSVRFLSGRTQLRWTAKAARVARRIFDRRDTGAAVRAASDRLIMLCQPFHGANPIHMYKPPFGLARYDPRFSADEA
jgi:tRNA (mo5U34)-methyltransferase